MIPTGAVRAKATWPSHRCVAALQRQHYAGWVAVEPFIYQPDGPACAARAAGFMRALSEATP